LKLPSGKRMKRGARNVWRALRTGFHDFTDGALSEPKKFIMICALVIIAIILTYFASLCLWMLPVTIYLVFIAMGARKPMKRSKRFRMFEVGLSVFVAAMLALGGALGFMMYEAGKISPAHIHQDYLEPDTSNGWKEDGDLHYEESLAMGTIRAVTKGYRFYGSLTPPYEGLILVITVKRVPMLSKEDLENLILERLEGYEGLELKKGTKTTGTRQIWAGPTTYYFNYNAILTAEGSDPFTATFMPGAKIKIRGEFWYCEEQGQTIAVVGGAQYGYDFEEGQYATRLMDFYTKENYPDDFRTWTTVLNLIGYTVC
jgi:hypothetical protein